MKKTLKGLIAVTASVISTGGGVIKRSQNITRLKQNGIICFIDRPLELLEATSSRPLSNNKNDLEKLGLNSFSNLYFKPVFLFLELILLII